MSAPPSGKIVNQDDDRIGFHITLDDYHRLQELLIDMAIDPGTQPAFGRGIFRTLGAFQGVLISGEAPNESVRTPALTEQNFNDLRSQRKNYT